MVGGGCSFNKQINGSPRKEVGFGSILCNVQIAGVGFYNFHSLRDTEETAKCSYCEWMVSFFDSFWPLCPQTYHPSCFYFLIVWLFSERSWGSPSHLLLCNSLIPASGRHFLAWSRYLHIPGHLDIFICIFNQHFKLTGYVPVCSCGYLVYTTDSLLLNQICLPKPDSPPACFLIPMFESTFLLLRLWTT